MSDVHNGSDYRRHPRLSLPAAYTFVRVKPAGARRFRWSGHAYDISRGGLRFELDQPLASGTQIDIRLMAPGCQTQPLQLAGRVVRLHDGDEPGPVRMAAVIERCHDPHDQQRLDALTMPMAA